MVGRDDGEIVGAQGALEFGHPGVELFQRAAVAFDIVAMPELLVEVHQVDKDHTGIVAPHSLQRLLHTLGVVLSLGRFADSPAQEDVEDFTDGVDHDAAVIELVEQHAPGRRHGVIVAVGGAFEGSRRAGKRPRNHAAHFVGAAQDLARGFAYFVKFPQRNHLFVRGYLEDAVGRRVDDGRARPHVRSPQFLDDLGARSGLVAERAAPGAPLEFTHDIGRKAPRKERERLGEVDTRHFPMPRGSVLARRAQGAFAIGGSGGLRRRDSSKGLDVAEAHLGEVGELEAAQAGQVA